MLPINEQDSLLEKVIEHSPVGMAIIDYGGAYLSANPAYCAMYGYKREEMLGQSFTMVLSPHERGSAITSHQKFLDEGGSLGGEIEVVRRDGTPLWVSYESVALPLASGQPARLAYVIDLTKHQHTEQALRMEIEKNRALVRNASDGVHIVDMDGDIVEASDSFCTMLGYQREEVIGMNVAQLDTHLSSEEIAKTIQQQMLNPHQQRLETRHRRKDGSTFDVEVNILPFVLAGTHLLFASSRDIAERKKADNKIRELAFSDPLTGLPNRTLLRDRLRQALLATSRQGGCGALLFIDLDNFKALNDTQGHDIGDLLLKQVAQRLSLCGRADDTVARLGGDEFVVMLTGFHSDRESNVSAIEKIVEKILAAINEPYELGSLHYRCTSSIGVSIFGGDSTDNVDDLMKQADLAMYKSKDEGRNAWRFFDPEMERAAKARMALEEDLRQGLEGKQFVLHYQPQWANGSLIGVEALLRWQHPQRGLVLPGEFIQVAESTKLILPLGRWVLEEACRQLVLWADQPELAHLSIAVNVSAEQFHQSSFVDDVLAVLKSTGAKAERLKLELTESLLVTNVEDIVEKMFALKAKGIGFSLDDFGTGYSSLSYLKRLPLEQLKIDYSFVRDILIDPNDSSIAKTIIALGHSLGLAVVAEGVETEAQLNFLADAGCYIYQGFLFSRPLPRTEFEEYAKGL